MQLFIVFDKGFLNFYFSQKHPHEFQMVVVTKTTHFILYSKLGVHLKRIKESWLNLKKAKIYAKPSKDG